MHPVLGQVFAPKLWPSISHISGLLSHSFGSYICSAGWEGGGGCGWFLGGGESLLSALS